VYHTCLQAKAKESLAGTFWVEASRLLARRGQIVQLVVIIHVPTLAT